MKNARTRLLSAGVSWDVGGTGSKKVDAESFNTWTPNSSSARASAICRISSTMKPFAVTGSFGLAIPTRRYNKTSETEDDGNVDSDKEQNLISVQWGFTFQYNLQYLQSYVRDVGLPPPLNRMIPIVELALETPLDDPGPPDDRHGESGDHLVRPVFPARARGRRSDQHDIRARTSAPSRRSTSIWTTSCRRSSRGRRSSGVLGTEHHADPRSEAWLPAWTVAWGDTAALPAVRSFD